MNTKKIAGLICWLLAFLIPAGPSLLESENTRLDDGSPDNIMGLIAFVSFVFLIFLGYWLVDSAGEKKASHGH